MQKILSPNTLAIDLGTVNVICWIKGKGICFQEPTVVAIDPRQHKIIAVGQPAKEMLGKEPEGLEARRPIQGGSIIHYQVTEALLRRVISNSLSNFALTKHQVVISVPAGITSVEKRALIQALSAVGAGEIYIVPEPMAAAIGAKLPVEKPIGNMIVNLGGGTAEIAVISLRGIRTSKSIKVAGDALNQAIISFLETKCNLLIGENMAEHIKFTIGSALPLTEDRKMEVKGRAIKAGLPNSVEVSSNELVVALKPVLNQILDAIYEVLAETPPELAADISDYGIALSGGTSMLRRIDDLFSQALGVPVYVVEDPLRCVIRGLSEIANSIEHYRRFAASV